MQNDDQKTMSESATETNYILLGHHAKIQSLQPHPVVVLKPERYQPTKAELEEDVSIPTTPERLAKALGRKVTVRREKK